MNRTLVSPRAILFLTLLIAALACPAAAEFDAASLEREYTSQVRALVERYCNQCHEGDTAEADIDLSHFKTLSDLRKQTKIWQKVGEMLGTAQMPPKKAKNQPTDAERKILQQWVRAFLTQEAKAHAGDPGRVVLRRLSNAEYTYTVRDLTGVNTLSPARQFPVDGAAGEGFTNTGGALVMSPALVTKYLDAGKEIASHAMLLPDGIRFSPHRSRRDQTDALMAEIQAFYRMFTEDGGGVSVDLQGIKFSTNQGGRLPLKRYLAATLAERQALTSGAKTIAQVAAEKALSPRYLELLWNALNGPADKTPSPLMDPIRKAWRELKGVDPTPIVAQIEASHKLLWKFNAIGHIGREGGPKAWLEPVSPFVTKQDVRLPLPAAPRGQDVSIYLAAGDLGDGNERDVVVWHQPRIEFKAGKGAARPPILLRELRWHATSFEKMVTAEAAKTARYLSAVIALAAEDAKKPGGANAEDRLAALAKESQLDPRLLSRWVRVAGVSAPSARQLTGHFKTTVTKAGGWDAVNGWGSNQTPVLLTNRSDAEVSITTLTIPPRGVTLHPSPTQDAFVAWKSPMAGEVRITGKIADADNKCGNGAAWRVELTTTAATSTLASGQFDSGKAQEIGIKEPVTLKQGDVLTLVISARDKDHACDTTHVSWQITETQGGKRTWDLSKEIVDRILQGNPLADSFGNADVWHFGAIGGAGPQEEPLPAGSALARWREASRGKKPADEIERLALLVQEALTTTATEKLAEPDRALRLGLLADAGPLGWATMAAPVGAESAGDSAYGVDPKLFGRTPDGSPIDAASLSMRAPQVLEIKLPGGAYAGGELVATASLHPTLGKGGSAQVSATTSKPPESTFSLGSSMLATPGDQASPLQGAVREFHDLFPPVLCYARIVPVDEVVTLTLYHREDSHLRRLMLDDRQAARLDRLWDELLFVAQEPLALSVAFEQIAEFATQDRPDLVKSFAPLRKPIFDRADAFRKRMVDSEPAQVDAVVALAQRAYRRALTQGETSELRALYARLRSDELSHEEALRLTIARALVSPAFLYKAEKPVAGNKQGPVHGDELATRLSYFLWSSMPDAELRRAAGAGELADGDKLVAQMRRMLGDERTRRLATEFACQWLHIYEFDQLDEKSERHFPTFVHLRGAMYEETIRFFVDLFQNGGTVTGILDADHTFLNEALAKHYGITGAPGSPGAPGAEWRRVEGMRKHGRGGILGQATTLAKQSGASRTSPILRGNWISEVLLGDKLPRPPKDVPQLPDDESAFEGLSVRQITEKHSSDPRCAVCHDKIDAMGFSLEGFDAIGRRREKDAGNRPIDTSVKTREGVAFTGLPGLRDYLLTTRREAFVRQFCRKLLGYALGRGVQLSDEPLLDEMLSQLKAKDYRVDVAMEMIVRSRQFREIRGADAAYDD